MGTITLEKEYAAHEKALAETLRQCNGTIIDIAARLVDCFRQGHKLLLCGNGGSAADAQHVAAEFVNRFLFNHAAVPAIALTTDTSILTAVSNDTAFEFVFSRQVEALAVAEDVVAGISTSGRSANILRALESARSRGAVTIGFTGQDGHELMSTRCDVCLVIPVTETPRIQECHLFAWHVICGIVEETLFNNK